MRLQLRHGGAPRARVVSALLVTTVAAWLLVVASPRVIAAPQQAEPGGAPAAAEAASPAAPGTGEHAASHEAAPAQGEPAAGAHGKAAEGEHGGEGEQPESPWASIARLVNFAILAGGLVYLLKSPLMGYLEQRGITVRSDLTKAAALKQEAASQIERIEAKLKALPAEIEALKRRGAEEIAAEEARISALAETERTRLLQQAKREIDTQLHVAERDLKKRAGELAVAVATERVKRTITDGDQARLVERYVSQVRH
jgi:F-type H+-transporting ATPase subunit b